MATKTESFTAEELNAMKERAKEQRASGKGQKAAERAAQDLADVLEKIAEMPDADRVLAERVHALVLDAAPNLVPKTWYGQPAYTLDGKVICFFQSSSKFKTRYCTLGFSEDAQLDDGGMWPTSYGILKLSTADEKRITAMVKRAVGAS